MRYVFGEWSSSEKPLTLNDAEAILREASLRAEEISRYPLARIYSLLGRLSREWADENLPERREALELLPEATGFSREMTELALRALPGLLDPKTLSRKVETELRGMAPVGEEVMKSSSTTVLSWQPVGVVLHVLAGNVFLGGPGSLIEGLLTKNVSLLKMSSGERIFLPLFLKTLRRLDEDGVVSRSIALIDYPSSSKDVMETFKAGVDAVVVWGGEQAVRAYRENLSIHTRLIAFGPKLSFAFVTREGLRREGVQSLAAKLAMDLSIWDQNACTAPQIVYVEGEDSAEALGQALHLCMLEKTRSLPAGPVDMQTAVEIRKLRTVAEIAEAKKTGRLFASEKDLSHTVVVDGDPTLEASPLHRTVRLVPLTDLQEPLRQARRLRGFVQTVGLCAGFHEQNSLARELARAGAVRLVEIGAMAGGDIDDPHDGQYDLPQFVQTVLMRLPVPETVTGVADLDSADVLHKALEPRLLALLEEAKRSSFYGERLGDLKIETMSDLPKIPVLSRTDLETQMPPAGHGFQTRVPEGGYVSRSGGSTGEPKYSIYDGPDWEGMISHATGVFRALGLRRGDRLANCFMAGDLYGSFVSFDHINARMGVLTFAFAGQSTPEFFAQTYRKLGFNVIQGVPAFIIPLLRKAKELEPSLRLEKVIYAGAPLSTADREWLKEVLGVRRIASVIGANDGGQFAYQCEHQSGKHHHVIDDFNFLEIVDEQGTPVAEGQSGRVLITSLAKTAYPLIRYDIGDQARFVPGVCGCGSQRRVIEYLGRNDSVLSVGLMNFSQDDCLRVLSEWRVSELQVVARTEEGLDGILVNIEIENATPELASDLRKVFLQRLGKLEQRLQEKALSFEVRVFAPGNLPRNARTGKLKAVLDERV